MLIIDEEINFIEKEDLLGGKHYVDALVHAICHVPTGKTFTIGLFGEWGSGKSSIIKTARKQIEKEDKNDEIGFIYCDAWQYSGDSFKRRFISRVVDKLEIPCQNLYEKFYEISTEKTFNDYGKKAIIGLLIVLIMAAIWFKEDIIQFSILGFATYIMTLFINITNILANTRTVPLTFAAEQFHRCFSEIIYSNLSGNEECVKEPFEWIKLKKDCKKLSKLIIIIDNLDRNNAPEEILYDIKNFMSKYNNLVFVIPIDHYELCSRRGQYARQSEKLRKIFNLEIRIKPLEDGEIIKFAEHLNKKHSLGFNGEVLAIVSDRYATNPRRIIHFFNNLSEELEVLRSRMTSIEIEKYQDLICKALIIREEWGEYYKNIVKDPNLLIASDAKKDAFIGTPDELKKLNSFLNYTQKLSSGADDETLQKIVSNRKEYDGIPSEAIEAIKQGDLSALVKYLEKDRELIVDKIIRMLRSSFYGGAIKLSVNLFELITEINNKDKLFTKHQMNLIQDIYDDKFDSVLSYFNHDKYDSLAIFVNHAQSIGIASFSKACKSLIKTAASSHIPNDERDESFSAAKELFKNIILTQYSSKILENAEEVFIGYYREINPRIDFSKIINISAFYTDSLAEQCYQEIHRNGLDSIYIKNFVELMIYNQVADRFVEQFFRKLNEFINIRKPEEVAELLKILLPIVSHKHIKTNNAFVELIRKVFAPQNQGIFAYKLNDSNMEAVVEFLIRANKFLNNNIDISGSYTAVSDLSEERFIDIITKIYNSGFSINKYWDTLKRFLGLSEQYILLIDIISSEQKDGIFLVQDQDLLDFVNRIKLKYNNKEIDEAFGSISKDSRLYKLMFVS